MQTFHHSLNTFAREITSYFDDVFKNTGLSTSYIELLMLLQAMDGTKRAGRIAGFGTFDHYPVYWKT